MRKFSSYGPVDTQLHYYTPRTALITTACQHLLGEDPVSGGHYITIWAPRQTGKTWVMQRVVEQLNQLGTYDVAMITLQFAKDIQDAATVLEIFVRNLAQWFGKPLPTLAGWHELPQLFTATYFQKPVILILDEFEALEPPLLNRFVSEFRAIYTQRQNEAEKTSSDKTFLLHGLALIGVRSVLGIENVSGSPFNIQRSIQVPNLTYAEVHNMFQWYTQESGQPIEPGVIDQLYQEVRGQPGLTCWFGELLTEQYNTSKPAPMTLDNWTEVYAAAVKVLPNNNILNVVSKAKDPAYKPVVLELFKTDSKLAFTYDDFQLNYLYTHGVIDYERSERTEYYVRFASPFVQNRLFNAFAHELFPNLDRLYEPFADLSDTVTEHTLQVPRLLQRYEQYLQQNRGWLLQNVPRRATDQRIYEAVFHFNLYMYLARFLQSYRGRVIPEFPTGNGKIDLILEYAGARYGLELKSFVNRRAYQHALAQAAAYGQRLQLPVIFLVFFVEQVDDDNRRLFEQRYQDQITGVTVQPVFIATGQ